MYKVLFKQLKIQCKHTHIQAFVDICTYVAIGMNPRGKLNPLTQNKLKEMQKKGVQQA